MPARLVALSEGSDIPLDRAMMIVGRHPQCDARLDSIRISRRHCCMMQEHGDVIVRDLGSTNGIRINGQRVELGRLRPGDELSIAHLRYRLEGSNDIPEATLLDGQETGRARMLDIGLIPQVESPIVIPAAALPVGSNAAVDAGPLVAGIASSLPAGMENPLAAAVRELLPSALADRCRIQVIVQMDPGAEGQPSPGEVEPCPSNSSH